MAMVACVFSDSDREARDKEGDSRLLEGMGPSSDHAATLETPLVDKYTTEERDLLDRAALDQSGEKKGKKKPFLADMPLALADGILMWGPSAGILMGPPLGGSLYDHFGYLVPFYVAMSMSFCGGLLNLFLLPSVRKADASEGGGGHNVTSTEEVSPASVEDGKATETSAPARELTIWNVTWAILSNPASGVGLLAYFCDAAVTAMLDPIVSVIN